MKKENGIVVKVQTQNRITVPRALRTGSFARKTLVLTNGQSTQRWTGLKNTRVHVDELGLKAGDTIRLTRNEQTNKSTLYVDVKKVRCAAKA